MKKDEGKSSKKITRREFIKKSGRIAAGSAIAGSLLSIGIPRRIFAGEGGGQAPKGKIPKRVGYVTNYLMHEWYQNVTKGMRARAEMLGIDLEIIDANLDVNISLFMPERGNPVI